MTPHPNSNSSWCYFYMIFKVNHISRNSDSWASYIIIVLSAKRCLLLCCFYDFLQPVSHVSSSVTYCICVYKFLMHACMHSFIHPQIFPECSFQTHKGERTGPCLSRVLWHFFVLTTATGAPTGLSQRMDLIPGDSVLCLFEGPLLIFVGMGKNTSGSPCTMHPASHINSLKLNIKLSHLWIKCGLSSYLVNIPS